MIQNEKSILDNIAELELKSSKTSQSQFDIDDIIKNWDNYDIELKKSIAKNVIDVIILEGKNVDIKFFLVFYFSTLSISTG